jgi:hypothetical protein
VDNSRERDLLHVRVRSLAVRDVRAMCALSGWPKQELPTDQDIQISHEAIYRSLFIQTRGVLKKELTAHLRTLPSSNYLGCFNL